MAVDTHASYKRAFLIQAPENPSNRNAPYKKEWRTFPTLILKIRYSHPDRKARFHMQQDS